MIIVRSPLRISLGGGGTDLPSYYEEYGGFLVAAALDQYVYITVHEPFTEQVLLKYSKMEAVDSVEEVQHPIIRESMRMFGIAGHIEIASMSDIPAGTGLGSSGSFTTALLKALCTLKRKPLTPHELASLACEIEIGRLGEPIGKQDQYIAAVGGVTAFTFHPDGRVESRSLELSKETLHNLEDCLAMFFTGYTRSASSLLKDQHVRSQKRDQAMIENLHFVKKLGIASCEALEAGDLKRFAALMREHWEYKKARTQGMSNDKINEYYDLALKNGAESGKLIGAGGGGFLLFYTEDKKRLRRAMSEAGLREVRVKFDFEGTRVVVQS